MRDARGGRFAEDDAVQVALLQPAEVETLRVAPGLDEAERLDVEVAGVVEVGDVELDVAPRSAAIITATLAEK